MNHNRIELDLVDAESAKRFGEALAEVLQAGDLVILTGDLGAGKTTLTQGIGAGLGVRGQIASPTFVIAREHPSLSGGPTLVHVDAYRLNSLDDVDALDLDASLDEAVTIVEWGDGLVNTLSEDRLEIAITRPRGQQHASGHDTTDATEAASGVRRVTIQPVGARWDGVELPRSA